MSALESARALLAVWDDINAQPGMRMGKTPVTARTVAALQALVDECGGAAPRTAYIHRREEGVLVVEDLTRFSNAFLRRVADECERIIEERVNDGAFS